MMQGRPQAVNIRAWRRLRFSVLLGCRIACGAIGNSVFGLPCFEVAGDTKVNEKEVPLWSSHDVGWLEVTEDDRRLIVVQVIQHGCQLETDVEHFLWWQFPSSFVSIL